MVRLLGIKIPFPQADLTALDSPDTRSASAREVGEQVAYATGLDSNGDGHLLRTDTTGHLLQVEALAGTMATSQVTVDSSGETLIAANAARLGLLLTNSGTVPVFLGNAGVTATTGAALPGGASIALAFSGLVAGITATGSAVVTALELSA